MTDDDDPPMLSIQQNIFTSEDPQINAVQINVTLSNYSLFEITLDYVTADGTANMGSDFRNTSNKLIIPARQTKASFEVTIIDDSDEESDETFTVNLQNPMYVSFASESQKSTTITIVDNDTQDFKPRVMIMAVSTNIDIGDFAVFEIISLPRPRAPFDVYISSTIEGSIEFWRVPRKVKVSDRQSSFRVRTINTSLNNETNSITVSIDPRDELYRIGTKPTAKVTINDSQDVDRLPAPTRISIASAVVKTLLADPPRGNIEPQFADFGPNTEPIVSINAVEPKIEEGSLALFHILASRRISGTISVNLNVQDNGNFIKGTVLQTIQLSPANSPYLVSIETEEDMEAKADGMISVKILTGDGYVVGDSKIATVIISDLADRLRAKQIANLNQQVISQLLNSASDRSVSTISNRLNYTDNLSANPTFSLGNNHSLANFITTNGELLNDNSIPWYTLLDDTSFSIPLNHDNQGDHSTTIWGTGDYLSQTLSSSHFARSATGEGYVGNLGLDAQLGKHLFTGMAVSGSHIESVYEFNEIGSINYDSQLTILSPYMKFANSTQDSYLSAIFGIGSGAIAINEAEGSPISQSSQIFSSTLIGNYPVYSYTNDLRQSSGELSLYGQTGWQVQHLNNINNQNYTSEVRRDLQIGATASYDQKLIDTGSIKTTFSYELFGDYRDGETTLGQELANATNFVYQSGLSLSINSEIAFTPITQGHQTTISGTIEFDRHQDEVGLMIELTPTWVRTEGQKFSLPSNDDFLVAGDRVWDKPTNSKLIAEFGYGLPVLATTSLLTPYTKFEVIEGEESLLDIGVTMQAFNNFQMTLDYRQSPAHMTGNKLHLRSNLKW